MRQSRTLHRRRSEEASLLFRRRIVASFIGIAIFGVAWPAAGLAFRNVEMGQVIANEKLPVLGGGSEPFLGNALANVFVFFRPNQDHSLETLKQVAGCERDFEGRSVHWVAIVSDSFPENDVRYTLQQSGIRMPVLIDRGDTLYGRLGVKLHPSIGIADQEHRLAAYEPFKKINYCDTIRARIRFLLHEIDAAQVESAIHPPRASIPSGNEATARRYVMLGLIQLRTKQYDKALESARKSLEADPGLEGAQTLKGKALAGLGRYTEARQAFKNALKIDPKNPAALEGVKSCEGK